MNNLYQTTDDALRALEGAVRTTARPNGPAGALTIAQRAARKAACWYVAVLAGTCPPSSTPTSMSDDGDFDPPQHPAPRRKREAERD
jgi:hypothetical protein